MFINLHGEIHQGHDIPPIKLDTAFGLEMLKHATKVGELVADQVFAVCCRTGTYVTVMIRMRFPKSLSNQSPSITFHAD